MFSEYGDILSIEEVCTVLLIGRNRAYELLNSGVLKGFRIPELIAIICDLCSCENKVCQTYFQGIV